MGNLIVLVIYSIGYMLTEHFMFSKIYTFHYKKRDSISLRINPVYNFLTYP